MDGLQHGGGCVVTYPQRVIDLTDDEAALLHEIVKGQQEIAGYYEPAVLMAKRLRHWLRVSETMLLDVVRLHDEQDVRIGRFRAALEAQREAARGHLAATGGCRLGICRRHTVRGMAVENLEREPAPAA